MPSHGCCALLCHGWVKYGSAMWVCMGEASFWTSQLAAVRSKHGLCRVYESLIAEPGSYPWISTSLVLLTLRDLLGFV